MTDKLSYFDIRGRAEPVRMMYALAGKDLDDDRIKSTEWEGRKKGMYPNSCCFMSPISCIRQIGLSKTILRLGHLPSTEEQVVANLVFV